MERAEAEDDHIKFKRKKSKNLWNVPQKEAAWDLFATGKLDPRALPTKKIILSVVEQDIVFREYFGKRYPQLREHLRKLAAKFILRDEIKDKRRPEGKSYFCFLVLK